MRVQTGPPQPANTSCSQDHLADLIYPSYNGSSPPGSLNTEGLCCLISETERMRSPSPGDVVVLTTMVVNFLRECLFLKPSSECPQIPFSHPNEVQAL